MRRTVTRATIGAGDNTPRTVTVTCSTETVGSDGCVLVSSGIDLERFRANPVFLFQHNPDWPVARAEQIDVVDDKLIAHVTFPPPGASPRADEVLALIRAGVINAASTGFEVLEAAPLDPSKPTEGEMISASRLYEMSFVSIPAVPDALITSRAVQARFWSNAERGVFDDAGTIMANRTAAETIATRSSAAKAVLVKRGLYQVGGLAYLLEELGWQKENAEWEASVENDGSTVPAQLGAALKMLGDVLISMTEEEVAELVGGVDVELEVDPADSAEVELVQNAASPKLARFRLGAHRIRRALAVGATRAAPVVPKTTVVKARSTAFHRDMAALYARSLETA